MKASSFELAERFETVLWEGTRGPRSRRGWPDPWLLLAVSVLLAIGWAMIFSTTYFPAAHREGRPFGYVVRHSVYLLLGIGLGFAAARVRIEKWQEWARPAFFFTMGLLVLVLVSPLGEERGGAHRWLKVWGSSLTFQPSELAKFTLVLQLARFLARREAVKDLWSDVLPALTFTCVPAVLILVQPDFGTSMILICTGLAMLYVGGAPRSYFVFFSLLGVVGAAAAVWWEPYRLRRILCFLDPSVDPRGSCFQLTQSLIAFGAGGWFGAGLGNGWQKLYFLPEAHTDFIFAVIGEELGIVGAALVIALFACLALRGFRVAQRETDPFASYVAFGITFSLTLEALFNAAVVVGLAPTKGLAMPFLSYGGSALVLAFVRVGLLLNLSRRVG